MPHEARLQFSDRCASDELHRQVKFILEQIHGIEDSLYGMDNGNYNTGQVNMILDMPLGKTSSPLCARPHRTGLPTNTARAPSAIALQIPVEFTYVNQ